MKYVFVFIFLGIIFIIADWLGGWQNAIGFMLVWIASDIACITMEKEKNDTST